MSTTDNMGGGKRASEVIRAQREASPHALAETLLTHGQAAEQFVATQEFAAVAGILSSTNSTPTGTPHARKANISASLMHMEATKSIMHEQHAMVVAMHIAGQTVEAGAARTVEMHALMENDQESTLSVRYAHTQRTRMLPHASIATWHMHNILICIL